MEACAGLDEGRGMRASPVRTRIGMPEGFSDVRDVMPLDVEHGVRVDPPETDALRHRRVGLRGITAPAYEKPAKRHVVGDEAIDDVAVLSVKGAFLTVFLERYKLRMRRLTTIAADHRTDEGEGDRSNV